MALVAKMIGDSVAGERGPRWEPCTPQTPGAVHAGNIWGTVRPPWVDQVATHFVQHPGKMLERVKLQCVHTGDPDDPNLEWTQASPTGHLELTIQNPAAFGFVREGVEYLVRITEVRARDRNWEPATSDEQDDLIVRALFDLPMREDEAFWVSRRIDGEPGQVREAKVFPSSRVRTGPLCDVPDSAMWADVPAAVGDEVVVTWWPADRRDEAERSDDMTVSWIPNPRRTYIEEIFPRSEAWTAEQYEREIERQVASATVRGGRLVGGIVVQSVHLHSDGNGAPGTSVQDDV